MSDSLGNGLILLVCQSGKPGHWVLDLASLRPYVASVLSVQSGRGIDLRAGLGEAFPGVPVEQLRLEPGRDIDRDTRRLHAGLHALGDWVLVLNSGSSALIGRRFQIPERSQPYNALHLLPEAGQAQWAPVLVPNRPEYLRVGPSGEVIVDVDPFGAGQLRELVVDRRVRPVASAKSVARDLDKALAEARRNESPHALFSVAECHFLLKRYAEAEFWYRRFLELDVSGDPETHWSALYRSALCLKAMNRPWARVEEALSTAFDLDPDRAEPLYHIACRYLDVHSYSKAFELSAVGLEIDMPDTGSPFEYSIYQYELPLVYMSCAARLGKHQECVRLANGILRRPGVPDKARAEVVQLRSGSLDRIQPLYPLSIHKKNRIVVVTAFRNAGAFLESCVASLAAQDYEQCRFVLIDDASTDGALDALDIKDPRFVIESNALRQGVLRNQLDAVIKYCRPDDIVVYVDGDDRLLDDSALGFINDFFNSTRCWLMYGQYRNSHGKYGSCEPIIDESGDVLSAIGDMRFPMHVRAHRAGLIDHLRRVDPELLRLRGDNGEFLDSIADLALMRALMQLAGLEHIRYNDRVLYEYNAGNPESHYSAFERKQLQDRQSRMLERRDPLRPVSFYSPDMGQARKTTRGTGRTRLLFVALDGMSPGLLREWGSAGLLPTLHRLLQDGHIRDVTVPKGLGNDVFWTCLCTGTMPDEIGYYYRNRWDAAQNRFRLHDVGNEVPEEPFWSKIANSEEELAVIDFPELRNMGGRVNGLEVTEWITHARVLSPRFVPPALKADWLARFGDDPVGGSTEVLLPRTGEQFAGVRDRLLESVEVKTRAALHYLDRGGWDFFAVAYNQGHDMGHQFWHVHDATHPGHRPRWLERYGDPLLQVYQRIDQAVARLVGRAGEGCGVIIVTGMAMGLKASCNPVLDRVLWEIQNAEYGPAEGSYHRERFENRRFFAVPNNNLAGAVRINLEGRERHGLVSRGPCYRETLDRIERCLRQVANAETGEPVIREFVRIHETYSGPNIDALPDMLAVWNRATPIRRIRSPWFEEMEVRPTGVTDTRTGDHLEKAELAANFELPFPEGASVPLRDIAPWLTALIQDAEPGGRVPGIV